MCVRVSLGTLHAQSPASTALPDQSNHLTGLKCVTGGLRSEITAHAPGAFLCVFVLAKLPIATVDFSCVYLRLGVFIEITFGR